MPKSRKRAARLTNPSPLQLELPRHSPRQGKLALAHALQTLKQTWNPSSHAFPHPFVTR
jgi:hypothetical protein